MRTKIVGIAVVFLLVCLTACGTSATTADSQPVGGIIIDDRTVLFNQDANAAWNYTPDNIVLESVLASVDTQPELEVAREHHRYIFGIDRDEPTIFLFLACNQPALTDLAQAYDLYEEASQVDGGGDCYRSARFAEDGTLISILATGGGS